MFVCTTSTLMGADLPQLGVPESFDCSIGIMNLCDAMRGRIAIIANGMLRVTHISRPLVASSQEVIGIIRIRVFEIYVIIVGMSNPRDLADVWLVSVNRLVVSGIGDRAHKVIRVITEMSCDGSVVFEVGITQESAAIGIAERP